MNWNQLQSASLESIIDWAASHPWCKAMQACAQDAKWHSEGDVWTHTQMVMHQLHELESWQDLSPHEQNVLVFTALLHDVAKPLTTQIDPGTGNVVSPKHALKGEQLARTILRDCGCDLATREEIARMVRYHGRPVFVMHKNDPTREVVRHSWLVNNRLLYLFALADFRGRDSHTNTRSEEDLHFWKIAAEEAHCYDQPYRFASEHARFLFFRQTNPNLHYVPHENFSCHVTVMAGLPGSGKDRWLAQHKGDLPVVSLDEIRGDLMIDPTDNQGKVIQQAKAVCRRHLRTGNSFAFNATNIMQMTRGRWLDLFADYGARIELVYIEPPLEVIFQQNKARDTVVPESIIRRLAGKLEPPTWAEVHHLTLLEG
ncbi:HD domain-containing protein [Bremerella cremea]|uniref:HD domain-containing protein n=1 Tax=Bremerella cremea TaxID=1031537 RepID=A0A368KZD0_9BACT|nr:AAA family ATPase [Bremerella cremea]RCS54812.1 HD domain-containing protein [Bremerella cremea]